MLFLLAACGGSGEKSPTVNNTASAGVEAPETPKRSGYRSTAPVGPGERDRIPEPPQEFAVRVLKAVKSGDVKALASLLAPDGVLLSPDLHVDEEDVRLKPEEFLKAWEENRTFVWGHEAGSGRPIEMGIREFFKRYLYGRDYLSAPEIATNRRLGRGNVKDNVKDVYPDAVFVEFHFPGTEKNGGMDWSSLRVVLRKYGEDWKVVALLHDGWSP